MRQQVTPNDVVIQLSRLARDLDVLVAAAEKADRDWVEKKLAADLAESRALVVLAKAEADGEVKPTTVDVKRAQVAYETRALRFDAEVAEQVLRGLKRQIDACRVRIDVGRTIGATLRSEMSLAGQDGAA